MNTGFGGAFVISWTQAKLNGRAGAPVSAVTVGSTWRWCGRAARVDSPGDVLVLRNPVATDTSSRLPSIDLRKLTRAADFRDETEAPLFDAWFDVTDGLRRFRATLVKSGQNHHPLVLFRNEVPPAETDLRIVGVMTEPYLASAQAPAPEGTICFTPGTRISTADGPRLVEDLREGDRVTTKDSGSQSVLWVGSRRITGARMHVMPHLRPIRLRANVLGQDQPDADLIVSPDHRVLLKGRMSEALFNTDEVLVAAKDLVNDATITVDHALRSVTYIHLMLPAHQIVWANGIQTESFNPSLAALHEVDPKQRQRLYDCMPVLEKDPTAYGMPVRRTLNRSEAALMRHEMA